MIISQNVILYSLIVSVMLSVLWGVWRLTGLRRHTHWRVNRIVLVLISVISLIIGIIPFVLPGDGSVSAVVEVNPSAVHVTDNVALSPQNIGEKVTHVYEYRHILRYIAFVYWIGFSVSLIIMIAGLCQVVYIIMTGKASVSNRHVLFSGQKNLMPFSWGRWIVMPQTASPEADPVVLTHEEAHLRYRHWLDLILINIVKAVTWYCPVTYAIAHDMAENHEFEADNSVIKAGYTISDYQLYLVEKAARRRLANSVVCGINNPYLLLKKRILMMQKEKSKRSVSLRALGFIPVVILLAFAATSPVLALCVQKDYKSANTTTVSRMEASEVAIVLTDEEIMQPRQKEIALPEVNRNVTSKWTSTLAYPGNLAENGIQGRVILKAKVNTAGEITDISTFNSSGYEEFDNAAIKAITGTTGMSCATYKGKKADIDILIPVAFKTASGPELPAIEGNSGFMLDEIVAITQ